LTHAADLQTHICDQATVVFSALATLPVLLFVAFVQPKGSIDPGTTFMVLPAVLFPICFIYAEQLRARMPTSKW
jgi:hypothetical protein